MQTCKLFILVSKSLRTMDQKYEVIILLLNNHSFLANIFLNYTKKHTMCMQNTLKFQNTKHTKIIHNSQ